MHDNENWPNILLKFVRPFFIIIHDEKVNWKLKLLISKIAYAMSIAQ